VECAENMPKYFAKRLHLFMSGAGTKDTDLIRVIVDRCDVDLGDICTEYANKYNKPLKDVVAVTNIQKYTILFQLKFNQNLQSETSGYYRKALLAMIG
jgi:Annexin